MRIAGKMLIMRRILVVILFFLFTLFISGNCFAEVYKWVDEGGVVHFTDDISQVPEKYRPKIESIGSPEEREETKVEGEEGPKKKEETYTDQSGRGEDYWKGRVAEWRQKLREQQDKLEGLIVKYNGLTEKFNESRSTAERGIVRKQRDQVKAEMDQTKGQIDEARNMLEKKIPEEAELYKAKPEWVR